MQFFKPYFQPKPQPVEEADASGFAGTSDFSIGTATEEPSSAAAPVMKKIKRTAALDLLVIRLSLFIEMCGYFLLAWNPSPPVFVLISLCLTLGSGASPATNSLALSLLPNSRETGRLFGGLAVVQALGATLLSPLLFGTLFAYTVGWYAPTVFALASALFFLSQVAYFFVRLPKDPEAGQKAERGRSRMVKRVKSSAINRTVDGPSSQ